MRIFEELNHNLLFFSDDEEDEQSEQEEEMSDVEDDEERLVEYDSEENEVSLILFPFTNMNELHKCNNK